MNLPGLSIRRPVTVVMAILVIMLIGSVSLSRLKLDLLPDLNMPTAVVTIKYEGAGPREIESLITKPLESALTTVSNIKSIQTVSTSEYSLCVLNFADGTDMNFAALEMREKVDMVKPYLPSGIKDIMVMRIDPNNFQSTMEIGISSSLKLEELTRIAKDQIANKLERINGIASVTLSGGMSEQVVIRLLPEKLSLYGLNELQISQYLGTENINIPAGNIETSGMSIFLRTNGEFGNIGEIESLAVPTNKGSVVALKDLADISLTYKEKSSESYINGKLSVNLSVQKQSGANTVLVCNAVNSELAKIQKQYPDIHFMVVYDASTYIKTAIRTVIESAVQGAVLSIIILYLFLRNVRATLIIAVSIPVSIIATFVIMYFFNINLNLISMAGLALGVGMVVDNSNVVLENIYRHRHEGKSLKEAAEHGTREVMTAITASTMTSVAVFIPIVFVEGITGKVFKEMAITITFSLIASLIIALTFIPMVASKLLSIEYIRKHYDKPPIGTRLFDLWESFYNKLCKGYSNLLELCIRKKGQTIFIAVLFFGLSLISLPFVGFEYFPKMDEGMLEMQVLLPKGSSLEETHGAAFDIQERIKAIPEIQEIYLTIGNSGFVLDRSSTEKASLTIDIGSVKDRKRSANEIADNIRRLVSDIPGAKIKIIDNSKVMGFSIGSNDIDIRVTGDNIDELKHVARDLTGIISGIDGIREPESSLDEEIDEMVVRIDRSKALIHGLTTAEIGRAIQARVKGVIATRYQHRGAENDVVVCFAEDQINSIRQLNALTILTPRGTSVPLSELASITKEKSPPNITREDQKRTVTITAGLNGIALNKATDAIKQAFSQYDFPKGCSYSFGGQQQKLFESFDDLLGALLLSVFIVYMILAAQFESFLHPFTIMLSVPLALTGGLISLLLLGKTLSIPAFIGIIILVGIVVNNAIVLIDSINRFREEGMGREEAILKAGSLRLRPILMTTLTTILGMLPMAFEGKEGSEMQAPLAVVVIGGLTISTFVSLIVLPSVYLAFESLLDRIKAKVRKKMAKVS